MLTIIANIAGGLVCGIIIAFVLYKVDNRKTKRDRAMYSVTDKASKRVEKAIKDTRSEPYHELPGEPGHKADMPEDRFHEPPQPTQKIDPHRSSIRANMGAGRPSIVPKALRKENNNQKGLKIGGYVAPKPDGRSHPKGVRNYMIYCLIRDHYNGRPLSYEKIAELTGWNSYRGISDVLRYLVNNGWIEAGKVYRAHRPGAHSGRAYKVLK